MGKEKKRSQSLLPRCPVSQMQYPIHPTKNLEEVVLDFGIGSGFRMFFFEEF
ncbi:hypothetical protein APED_19225 [Acanthopleuribacter pedis]